MSAWLDARICDGAANCGMVYMGSRASACTYVWSSWGTYPECAISGGGTMMETVHVQLPSMYATCTPAP